MKRMFLGLSMMAAYNQHIINGNLGIAVLILGGFLFVMGFRKVSEAYRKFKSNKDNVVYENGTTTYNIGQDNYYNFIATGNVKINDNVYTDFNVVETPLENGTTKVELFRK
jgi:hypothetical protein